MNIRIIVHTKYQGIFQSSMMTMEPDEHEALLKSIREEKFSTFKIANEDSTRKQEICFPRQVLQESVIILEES